MSGEPTAEEREEQLRVLWRRVGKAARRGDRVEFERLSSEYAVAKSAHVTASHAEMKAQMRARRVRERAQVAQGAPRRWRLPAGFGRSPGARERDRQPPVPGVPQVPVGGHLRPWRRGWHPASEVIWRPGGRR